MKIKSAIIVVMAELVVFASVATVAGIAQKAQDADVSTIDAGFVPSTGQINLGYTPKVPSSSLAREIPSDADARAAYLASERLTYTFEHNETNGAASTEAEVTTPIGASPQTTPAKFSNANDTLDRIPIMAWPLGLNDQQRQRIYLTVMADKTAPATDIDDLKRASELPTQVALNELHVLPSSIGDITQVRGLEYVKTTDKVFLVSPASRIVVDTIAS
ncbi:MAG: hypothetical protein WA322_04850 [Pseudolabrys sp.]